MSDPGTTGFPSPVIAHEYLVHAAPETVYAWLKAHAGELDPLYMSPFSDELLKALLGRNNPIINLGVASVATETDILRTLWKSGNQAIRNAIAENPYRDYGILHILSAHDWADGAELRAALQSGDEDFVKLWCTNHSSSFRELEYAFLKQGIYENLTEERWLVVIYWSLQNPNLTVRDERHHEGTDYPAYRAAWSLLLTLPTTRTNAYLLCERYSKLNTFIAPYESLLDEEPSSMVTDRERWQRHQPEGEIVFLRRVFERWMASTSDDPNARDKDGNEAHEFQTLRQDVAAAVANRDYEIQSFVKHHEDVYVRRGYYRGGRFPSPVELLAAFEKDGKNFLEAAIHNDNLYRGYPKTIRTAFHQLVKYNPRYEEYPTPSFPSIWNYRAAELFKREPTHYPDPNIFEDDTSSPETFEITGPRQEFLHRVTRVVTNFLKWSCRIGENVLYVLLVWYVLSHLHGRPENIIVPVLGLIYVALRTTEISLGQMTLQHALALDAIQQRLQVMSDANYRRDPDEFKEIERMKARLTGHILIESISISVVSLICLWFLFNAL
jgi:hypothetical protein